MVGGGWGVGGIWELGGGCFGYGWQRQVYL